VRQHAGAPDNEGGFDMAKIVLGMATPHAPQVRLPVEGWYALREKDQTDRRINYAALLKRAKPNIEAELTDEVFHQRKDAIESSVRALADVLRRAQPDVMVVVGDDQHELFHEENMPMFCVYYGENIEVVKRSGHTRAGSQTWTAKGLDAIEEATRVALNVPKDHPGQPELAHHLIDALRAEDFDIACSNRLNPETGVGHAFTFVYEFLTNGYDIPIVPVMVNTFFPPNQPTPRRCYALGQALRRAIEAWDSGKTVAVVASGGLSHTIVDEEVDHMTIDAVVEKDADRLRSLPTDRLNLGTSEIRNWVTVAGAMEPLDVKLIGDDYIPAYRTPAGTGCGMAFAYWE
jgi:hypothetical protein